MYDDAPQSAMDERLGAILCSESVINVCMTMLHGCSFPNCETLTLSDYCLEHELFIQAEVEADRAQGSEHGEARRPGVPHAPA